MRGRPRILVNQFGGFGGYDIESLGSMAFPGAVEYSKATVSVLNKIGFDSDFARTMLSPPMQSQLNGLIVAIESTANALIKDVSAALESGGKSLLAEGNKLLAEGKGVLTDFRTATGIDAVKLAGSLAGMLQSLVAGDVEAVVKKGVLTAVDVGLQLLQQFAPALLSAIPGIGIMVSAVVQGLFLLIEKLNEPSAAEMMAKRKAEAEANMLVWLQDNCPKIAGGYVPQSSVAGAPTPADMFRDVFYAATIGDFLPPTLASVYVLLCGGESQGVGPTRGEYDSWLNKARKLFGNKIGIDPSTQRVMWELIKAIMSSTKSPLVTREFDLHGDQGKSAFGLLQEILRKELIFNKTWNRESARFLTTFLSSRYSFSKDYGGGSVVSNCGEYMGLEDALIKGQKSWQGLLEEKCEVSGPDGCKKWKSFESASSIAKARPGSRPKGILTLSRHSAEILTKSVMPNLRGKELADAKIAVGSVGSLAPVGLVLAGAAAVYAFSSLRSKGVS